MFGFGSDAYFLWATGASTGDQVVLRHSDQPSLRADAPHVHDPIGGGGVAMNAWHAAMLTSQYFSIGQQPWFRFTALLDSQSNPIEIPDGMAMNDPAIRQYTGVGENAKDVKNYMSVWQFFYDADKIVARWSNSGS